MNFYPFHIGDYASATRHLSWDEDLAYRRLIDAYYTREAPIPLDRRAVYRLVVASTPEQREAVDVILAEFFTETSDGWVNSRCEEEMASAIEKREKARESAMASVRSREQKKAELDRLAAAGAANEQANAQANAERSLNERSTNAQESTSERSENASGRLAPNPNPNPNPIGLTIVNPDLDHAPAKPDASPPAKQSRKRRLPDDFAPNETGREYAEAKGVNFDAELVGFLNFHTARGTAYVDWQAAWRTWCDKAVEFGRARGRPGQGPPFQPSLTETRASTIANLTGATQGPNHERDITPAKTTALR
jgi:uncharacterized protein YdaU (DUF1376 family)